MSIPVIPETTLGDEHVYSSLILTVITSVDAFIQGNSADATTSNLVRILLFAACSVYPLLVYYKTFVLYRYYKANFPAMTEKP